MSNMLITKVAARIEGEGTTHVLTLKKPARFNELGNLEDAYLAYLEAREIFDLGREAEVLSETGVPATPVPEASKQLATVATAHIEKLERVKTPIPSTVELEWPAALRKSVGDMAISRARRYFTDAEIKDTLDNIPAEGTSMNALHKATGLTDYYLTCLVALLEWKKYAKMEKVHDRLTRITKLRDWQPNQSWS